MKIFLISDVHGSLYYLDKALEAFKNSKADYLVCLGDFYYHGPRNPLPEGYNPKVVSLKFNELGDKLLVAINGNCDAEVDQMISTFTFVKNKEMEINGKKVYFHHGHHEVVNKDAYDIIFSGHTHIGVLDKIDGVIYANPGSISLPKAENSQGYMIFDENGIKHYDLLTNNLIKEIKF